MEISMRSMLTAGVTAVTAASIVAAPTIAPLPSPRAAVERTVELSAAVQTLTRQEVSSALVEIGKLAASTGVTTAAPTAAVSAATPLNAVSDAVVNAYNFVMTYVDYFALQLVPYALGFFPFSSLIIDQIYAIYPPVTDFTDSVVYDLVAPVLNDPLNLAVWANGISAVTYSAAASVLNVAINEVNVVINYFLGFIPPLPPIPPWPSLAAPATAAAAAAAVEAPTVTPGFAKPLARASQAALTPIAAAVADAATTAKTAVDTAVADLAGAVTPAKSAAPEAVAADTAVADPTPTTTTADDTSTGVAPDTDVTPTPSKASHTAKPGLATAAVNGAKKALKSVSKPGKSAKSAKSAGSAGGGA